MSEPTVQTASEPVILTEKKGYIGYIILNRPKKLPLLSANAKRPPARAESTKPWAFSFGWVFPIPQSRFGPEINAPSCPECCSGVRFR